MAKQAPQEDIDRWRRDDYWQIRKKYPHKVIAEKTKIAPSNLTRLVKGKRNPGAEYLKLFYMVFADELKQEGGRQSSDNHEQKDYDPNSHPLSETEEPAGERRTNEVEFLRAEFSKVTNTAQNNSDAFKNMSESNLILTKELAFYRKLVHPDKGES